LVPTTRPSYGRSLSTFNRGGQQVGKWKRAVKENKKRDGGSKGKFNRPNH